MQSQVFGRYALLDRLNMGGMAEVFLGKTLGLHDVARFVAIKRILPSVADDPEFMRMFIDEANLSVQLTHSNIAQTFELGRIGRSLYIAMEYVSGVDLRHVWEAMQEGHEFPIPALVYIVAKLCEGLDYAHRKTDPEGRPLGIVHRDISPQNVMLAYDGQVKVIDFGIAKAKVRASQTRVGILKGKFAYMSPEQVAGTELDSRSDVFSVGILLFELLTRSRLFKSDSDFMTLERVRHVELFPPRLLNPNIPRELEDIVLKTLSRDREERTQSAEQLHDMLMHFAIKNGETCSARELGSLLAKQFVERLRDERERLGAYQKLDVDSEGMSGSISGALSGALNTGSETFASASHALVSSAKTQIMRLEPSGSKRSQARAQAVGAETRLLMPMGDELSDTPNFRAPGAPRKRPPPPPEPQPTRVTPQAMDEVTSKVRRSEQQAPVPRGSPQRITSPGMPRLSFVPERSGSRELVYVWLAMLVAAGLLVLAFWVRGQLNPAARLMIDVEPPSAELLVNERRLGAVTQSGFEVQPGDVLVEVRAPGYCSWYRHLTLAARETFSTRVSLALRGGTAQCP